MKNKLYYQLLRTKNNYNQLLYTQKEAKELSQILFSYNNSKKRKMVLWFLIKGTVKLPEDQYKIDQAFNLVQKQHLNFQEYVTPQEIINRTDKSTLRINAQTQVFNLDIQLTFSNKKVLRNGIVIYNVDNSKEGQKAIRKVIDINWGYDNNPWCLVARKDGFIRANRQQIQKMSQYQKQKIGLYDDDCLSVAWNYWSKIYNAYPKRIAFQNNKLLAFCANNKKEILWWDRNDYYTSNIPGLKNEDDLNWYNIQYNAIKLAKNPKTTLEILNQLANDKDQYIRQSVAINPNTSPEILNKLANDKNKFVRWNVIENPNTSLECLKKLVYDKDKNIKFKAISNPNISLKNLSQLVNIYDQHIRQSIVENPNTSSEILQNIFNYSDNSSSVLIKLAINPNTPIYILQKLFNNNIFNDENKIVIAYNFNYLPIKFLNKLANDTNKLVRANITYNLNTPLEILNKLSNDENYIVRAGVATNINASLEILNKLANDNNYFVKSCVAENLNTPLEILSKLANDKNQNVRKCIAENPNTHFEILSKLANDDNASIRENVAKNKNTHINTLKKLANDTNKYVRKAAKLILNNFEK